MHIRARTLKHHLFGGLTATAAILFAMAHGAMAGEAAAAKQAGARRPNVLFVFSDMQRAYSMGCYGDANARTPHLDKLARQGARFDAAMSTTPVCCPFRACLMTGQYAHHHGMMSNQVDFLPKVKCLAETFRDAGYATGYSGKWHLEYPRKGAADRRFGFPPDGSEYGNYRTNRDSSQTTAIALRFIAEKSKGQSPWLMCVSWILPHAPYKAPPGYREHFTNVRIPPNVPPGAAREYAQACLPDYYGMIESIDDEFGRIVQALDKAGVAEDTIVVFTSDHGDMIGCQGLKAKRWPHEESARVPFLMRWPRGIPAGRVIADPMGSPDIYPTLCGLAGVAPPKGLDGADFSAFIAGKAAAPPRDYVYLEMPYAYVPWPGWRAIRTRDYMYARTADKPWLLFNVAKDPWEMKNLVADPAEQSLVRQMDQRLQAIMHQAGDSWAMKANSGDLAAWVPGGVKQQTQNLGGDFPGKATEMKSKARGGKKQRRAARGGDTE